MGLLYKKLKDSEGQEYMAIYETYGLNKPILVFGPDQMDKLIDEWGKKK